MPEPTQEELEERKSATISTLLRAVGELLILKFGHMPITKNEARMLAFVAPSVVAVLPMVTNYYQRFHTRFRGLEIVDTSKEGSQPEGAKHEHSHYSNDSVAPSKGVREICNTGQCKNPVRVVDPT